MRYRFLEFVLDTEQQTLAGPAGVVPLRRQSFLVLQHLVEHAPAVASKDELLDAVWGHQAISSSAVAQTVRELRDALADHAEHPRAIETRHRVGYRFIAPVTGDPATAPGNVSDSAPPDPPFMRAARHSTDLSASMRLRVAVAVPLLAVALAAVALLPRMQTPPAAEGSSWPTHPQAQRIARQAMLAARRFDTVVTLDELSQARAAEDQPRLALWQGWLHLLRGERSIAEPILAALEATRAHLHRSDQVMLDALQHEAAGRYASALEAWRIVYEIDPADVDVGLALFDMDLHERTNDLRATWDRVSQLDGIPSERLLLMSAQLARYERDADREATQAQAAMAASGTRWPALTALAQAEIGRSLKERGKISEARDLFAQAVNGLERQGLLRAAIDLRLDQLDPALAQGDMKNVAAELEALQHRVEKAGDNYSAGRLLHARGRLARRLGQDEQAIAFYAAAAQQHEIARNRDGVASALSAEAGPLQRLGRSAEARAVLDRALQLADETGTASIRASVHGNLANLAAKEARYGDAREHYQAALSLFRKLHDQRLQAVTLGNLANLAVFQGDLRSVEKLNSDALALFRALKQPPDIARTLIDIASAALDKGDLDEAGKLALEASTIFKQLEDPNRLATALALGADVRIHAADLEGADAMLDAAERTGASEAETLAIIATLRGRIALLRDQTPAARGAFERALAHRTAADNRAMQRASRLDIAGVDLIEKRLSAAEQATLAVIVQAREDKQPAAECNARLLLARILLDQERKPDAERELGAARALLEAVPQFDGEAAWTLLRARMDPAPERIERLEWLVDHARAHQQTLLELRALGALYAETADARIGEWRDRVRALGLTALLRPRLVLGS